jgi:hypothetical protein
MSFLGYLLKGPASMSCVVLLVLFVAAAKILAVIAGTSIDLTNLTCQPAYPVLDK